jgi:hypothetical protein
MEKKVYQVWGKLALTKKGLAQGDVSFTLYIKDIKIDIYDDMFILNTNAYFVRLLENLTGLIVTDINYELIPIKQLATEE